MLEKFEILVVIIALFLAFYFVISIGAREKKGNLKSQKIKNYLFGVRILIIIVASVSIILWSFI